MIFMMMMMMQERPVPLWNVPNIVIYATNALSCPTLYGDMKCDNLWIWIFKAV